jgi:glycosyltransferase involved in cell wall biosynthesis
MYVSNNGATRGDGQPLLSVLMPVYNEERTLRQVVEAVQAVALDKEIILVDDGSRDASPQIIDELADGARIRAYHHARNQGKGAAVRTAVSHARGQLVVIQDADLEYDPQDYHALVAPLLAGKADVVFGSRAFSSHSAYSFWFVLGNRLVTLATNVLYNCYISDMETCYKVMRREILQGLRLRSRGFEIEPEITAKLVKRGHRIYEVPISYAARSREEGKKLTWTDGITAIRTLVRYRFGDKPSVHRQAQAAEPLAGLRPAMGYAHVAGPGSQPPAGVRATSALTSEAVG